MALRDGRSECGLRTLDDTTSRKPIRIRHAARRLAAIVEFSSDAIFAENLNGIITDWNEGARKLFGYAAEETIGRSVRMLIPDDRVDEEPGILARIRGGGGTYRTL